MRRWLPPAFVLFCFLAVANVVYIYMFRLAEFQEAVMKQAAEQTIATLFTSLVDNPGPKNSTDTTRHNVPVPRQAVAVGGSEVAISKTFATADPSSDETQCHITQESQVESRKGSCRQLRVESDTLKDKIRAAYPEYDATLTSIRASAANASDDQDWFGEWWRRNQLISFPPVDCKNSLVRQFDYFLGSQTFVDLKFFFTSGKTFVRHANATTNLYTKNSLHAAATKEFSTGGMKDLHECLLQHVGTNAMPCLFLPTTNCRMPAASTSNATKNSTDEQSIPFMSREESFCGTATNRTKCLLHLAHPVPVRPKLQRSLSPDVSALGLRIFERMIQPSTVLQKAVENVKLPLIHPCVAIHIRRGDKLPECSRGKQASCAFLKNLTEYTDVAIDFLKQLNGRSIFVMTDDAEIVDNIDSVQGYPLVSLSGKTAPDMARSRNGLQELVVLLASLQMAGECDAFVGNSESEVSELAVLFACVQRGACPPVHSMNGRPLQAYEEYIVDGRASTVNVNWK